MPTVYWHIAYHNVSHINQFVSNFLELVVWLKLSPLVICATHGNCSWNVADASTILFWILSCSQTCPTLIRCWSLWTFFREHFSPALPSCAAGISLPYFCACAPRDRVHGTPLWFRRFRRTQTSRRKRRPPPPPTSHLPLSRRVGHAPNHSYYQLSRTKHCETCAVRRYFVWWCVPPRSCVCRWRCRPAWSRHPTSGASHSTASRPEGTTTYLIRYSIKPGNVLYSIR